MHWYYSLALTLGISWKAVTVPEKISCKMVGNNSNDITDNTEIMVLTKKNQIEFKFFGI